MKVINNFYKKYKRVPNNFSIFQGVASKTLLQFIVKIRAFVSSSSSSKRWIIADEMPELKIGTLWAPKISMIPSSSKTNPEKVTSVTRESELIYKPEKELVDGLFVPPRDPRKMNKILRKSIKDTTGQGWYANDLLEIQYFDLLF